MVKITTREREDITIVDIEGSLDVDSENAVSRITARNHSGRGGKLLLNFQGVDSLSSSGVAILVDAFRKLNSADRIAKLSNVGPDILDVFQVHMMLPIFNIHTDEESAIKQFHIDRKVKDKKYVRLFERFDVELNARFKKFKKGTPPTLFPTHEAEVNILSQCGLFLRTTDNYPSDTTLEVNLALSDETIRDPYVRFLAKVVWVADEKVHPPLFPGMALNILFLEKSERLKLEGYCVKHGG